MATSEDRFRAEDRFESVFAHLGALSAYAARRGCADPEGIAAETMAIAWRRLADVPRDDPRPWLFATARNLAYAEWRSRRRTSRVDIDDLELPAPADEPAALADDLDPAIAAALRQLSEPDREALLLVAWEELTPALAAASLGIGASAFRVRLHRARRRFRAALEATAQGRSTSRDIGGGTLATHRPGMEER
jgi:RNA polymerase sigma-70 factor (ECF subfamily)